jgi:integrase
MNEHTQLETPPETKRLSLSPVPGKEGLFTGIKSDGKPYTVRKDRHRVFFPDEWRKFDTSLGDSNKDMKKMLFETLLITGARIEEALNIRVKDFSFDRNYLRLFVTKVKARKKESKVMGGAARSFVVSSQYMKKVRAYIKENNLTEEDKLFNYSKQGAYQFFRHRLQDIGIVDWYNFSLHNIRKTCGMWLKALIPFSRSITEGEICTRLGHDMNTFLKHYASPSIFNERDKNMMIKLFGDMYGLS